MISVKLGDVEATIAKFGAAQDALQLASAPYSHVVGIGPRAATSLKRVEALQLDFFDNVIKMRTDGGRTLTDSLVRHLALFAYQLPIGARVLIYHDDEEERALAVAMIIATERGMSAADMRSAFRKIQPYVTPNSAILSAYQRVAP